MSQEGVSPSAQAPAGSLSFRLLLSRMLGHASYGDSQIPPVGKRPATPAGKVGCVLALSILPHMVLSF